MKVRKQDAGKKPDVAGSGMDAGVKEERSRMQKWKRNKAGRRSKSRAEPDESKEAGCRKEAGRSRIRHGCRNENLMQPEAGMKAG